MTQCFLPQKPLPAGTTRYVTSHGRASMAVRAGILADPKSSQQVHRVRGAVRLASQADRALHHRLCRSAQIERGRARAQSAALPRSSRRALQRPERSDDRRPPGRGGSIRACVGRPATRGAPALALGAGSSPCEPSHAAPHPSSNQEAVSAGGTPEGLRSPLGARPAMAPRSDRTQTAPHESRVSRDT